MKPEPQVPDDCLPSRKAAGRHSTAPVKVIATCLDCGRYVETIIVWEQTHAIHHCPICRKFSRHSLTKITP